jgi:enediyne biosynthesis protein E4
MPHEDDFPIVLAELIERVVQPALQFLMNCGRRRRLVAVDELGDELHRRLVRPGRRLNALFPVDAAPLRFAMPAMRVDDPILSQVPQPKMERHRRVLQIFGQPLVCFEQNILNDVAGIDATGEHRIEPEVNNLPQRLAEFAKQPINGRRIAGLRLVDQPAGFLIVRPHAGSIVRDSRTVLGQRVLVMLSRRTATTFLFVVALAFNAGCTSKTATVASAVEEPEGIVWFEDVTDRVGIDFVHDAGPTGKYFMPQSVGSGAALFDCDGDGLLDIYLVQNAGPGSGKTNRLYAQRPDGTFEDVTAGSGLDVAGYGMGVAIGDINNDGLPDVLLTQYGGTRLFLNLGGRKFKEITEEAGLSNPLWGTSAAFIDYDRDGLLDLVIVNYVDYDPSWDCTAPSGQRDFCAPKVFIGTATKLFHNLGPRPAAPGRPAAPVVFEDVSVASGIGRVVGPGLGVAVADFNGDGWPDIFVANDGQPNRLWINQKNGKFVDQAVSRGVAYTSMGQAFAGMGIAIGDIDNDGLLDLYVSHLTSETNTLWKQGPRGQFVDKTGDWGLSSTQWRGTGFGTLMADFNNSGFLHIAVANGRVQRGGQAKDTGLPAFWEPYAERNQLLANTGKGKFEDISSKSDPFTGTYNVARGLACGDFNNDGAQDLLVTIIGGKARLFKNVAPNRGHWLQVRALDPKLKRDAYGAEITVRSGNQQWLRLVNPAESYLCSGSPVLHFGLGDAASIDGIDVVWPDGSRETFAGGPVDRRLVLAKGEGKLR